MSAGLGCSLDCMPALSVTLSSMQLVALYTVSVVLLPLLLPLAVLNFSNIFVCPISCNRDCSVHSFTVNAQLSKLVSAVAKMKLMLLKCRFCVDRSTIVISDAFRDPHHVMLVNCGSLHKCMH